MLRNYTHIFSNVEMGQERKPSPCCPSFNEGLLFDCISKNGNFAKSPTGRNFIRSARVAENSQARGS